MQRYRNTAVWNTEMGEGRSPSSHLFFPSSLPIFLMLRGSSALLYGLYRELLQVFEVFWRFLNFFWRTFGRLILRWLGVLLFCLGQDEPKPPYLCSTSPIFGLQGRLGVCIVVWVAAARRKKRRTSSVFLLVRSGLTGFQLYSVLVSCLEESQVACWWWWRSLGKKHCGVNHGKRICMANKTLV